HHPPTTLFDDEPVFDNLVNQLSEIFNGRRVVYLFGHEHQLVFYRPQVWTNNDCSSFIFHGRCIGNGGFPVQNQGQSRVKVMEAAQKYSNYVQAIEMGQGIDPKYGRNGWARILLCNNEATLEYYVVQSDNPQNGIQVATEIFRVDATTGVVTTDGLLINENNDMSVYSIANSEDVPALRRTKQSNQVSCCCCCHCVVS